jgi:ketosteroid isomerase-like protein
MDDVERLLIERECERLIVAYSHLIDMGEAARVAELFTEDGVWESADATMRGRAQIHAGFGRRQDNTARRSRHVCTNVAVAVTSATEATGLCYFTLYRADGVDTATAPVEGPEIVGEYRDAFVRTDDGWRIARRTASAGFVRRRPS